MDIDYHFFKQFLSKMKNKLGYFVLLVSTCCFSQNVQLGKVTKSELELKKYEKDTSATAVYLFKKAITKFQYFDGTDWIMDTFHVVGDHINDLEISSKKGWHLSMSTIAEELIRKVMLKYYQELLAVQIK